MISKLKDTLNEIIVKQDDIVEKQDRIISTLFIINEFAEKDSEKNNEILSQISRIADTKQRVISADAINKAQLIGIDLTINFKHGETDMRSISFDRGHANKMGGIILDQICKPKEQYASHIEKSERTCKFPLEP